MLISDDSARPRPDRSGAASPSARASASGTDTTPTGSTSRPRRSGAHAEDRASGRRDDPTRHAPEKEPRQPGPPVRADDEQVGAGRARGPDDPVVGDAPQQE